MSLPSLELRPLQPAQLDQLTALHRRAWDALPDRRFVYNRDRCYFEALVRGDGTVVGAFLDGALIGYSAVCFRPTEQQLDELCPFLAPVDRQRVAIHGSTLIDPSFRNRQVFTRLYGERIRLTQSAGFAHSVGIAFLLNRGSLAIAFRSGFTIRGTLVDPDPNLVVHLEHARGGGTHSLRDGLERRVDLADFDGHCSAIRSGLAGYRLSTIGRQACIDYGDPVALRLHPAPIG